MSNFFLLNEAINVQEFETFKSGMAELVAIDKEKEDFFHKHDSVWNLSIILTLMQNFGQEEQVICQFIEQMSSEVKNINSEDELIKKYINCCSGFLGIYFNSIISKTKQVTNAQSFDVCKSYYFLNTKFNDINQLRGALNYLFKNYNFEPQSLNDILYWNDFDITFYKRLCELLSDVQNNPFTGGIGKTEVLKNKKGAASKRLDQEHRIVYKIDNDKISILTCKGHYE